MNVETEIATALIAGTFALATTVGGYFAGKFKERALKDKDTERNIADGVRVLLSCRLHDHHERFTALGRIDIESIDEVRRVYSAYHALGGNGIGTGRAEELELLPRSKEAL